MTLFDLFIIVQMGFSIAILAAMFYWRDDWAEAVAINEDRKRRKR